jgi:hypothetical protein
MLQRWVGPWTGMGTWARLGVAMQWMQASHGVQQQGGSLTLAIACLWLHVAHGLQPPHGVQPQGGGLTVAIACHWLHVAHASVCFARVSHPACLPAWSPHHSACCVSVSQWSNLTLESEADAHTV